jgi:hypothetical protein
MRRSWQPAALLLSLPAFAQAAESARTVLDFTAPGPLKTYFDLAMAVARSYLPLAFILAVALEALGRPPGTPRNFGAVAWRFLVIAFLLVNYQRVFGFVVETTDDIADRLSPADALREYHDYLDTVYEPKDASSGGGGGGTGATTAGAAAVAPSKWSLSNLAFDGLMGVLLFLAKALVYGLERLARILTAVFFILGPLALVAGIPRPSNTGFAWFRHFVTVASWPIFSGILLGVMTAVAKQSVASRSGTYLGNLVSAVVMALCAIAAPVLSGWIVGGAAQNVAGLGHARFENLSRRLSQSAERLKKIVSNRSSGYGSGEAGGQGDGSGRKRGNEGGGSDGGSGRTRGFVASNPPSQGTHTVNETHLS